MQALNYYLQNWTWTIPATLIVADAVVKITPWQGDDEVISYLWKRYKEFKNK